MTLGIAIVCKDGIVLASDSQATMDSVAMKRTGETKINKINPLAYMIGAGSVSYGETILEKINQDSISNEDTANKIKRTLIDIIVDTTAECRDRYKRAMEDPKNAPNGNFILASYNEQPEVFVLDELGNCSGIEKYETIGSSCSYAEVILMNHYRAGITIDEAKKLVHWVLSQCKDLDPFVGGKIVMKILKPDGVVEELDENELKFMDEAYDFKKQNLSVLFSKIDKFPEILDLLESMEEGSNQTPN